MVAEGAKTKVNSPDWYSPDGIGGAFLEIENA